MNAATLVNILDMISVALLVAAIGFKSTPGLGLTFVRTRPRGAAKSMLAMFVVMPAVVLLAIWALPLEYPVAMALLALSVSPMPAVLAEQEKELGGRSDYVAGMLLLAPLVSLIAIPLFLWLAGGVFGRPIDHDLGPVLWILFLTIGAPLLLGMLVSQLAPVAAARLAGPFRRWGTWLLVIVSVAIVVLAWRDMIDALGNGTFLAITAVAGLGLLTGHLIGGPHRGNQRALALICSQRHPGVAMAIAVAVFPAEAQDILAAVVIYVLVSAAIALPYGRWAAASAKSRA
jgi:BASS family bile acid:Na+ symporter